MNSCICGRKIENWQTLCYFCWLVLDAHDKRYQTKYKEAVVEHFKRTGRRDYFSKEVIEVLRKKVQPSSARKIEKLKLKLKEKCKECERKTGKKSVDECFHCPYHVLFNKMLEEITSNGSGNIA